MERHLKGVNVVEGLEVFYKTFKASNSSNNLYKYLFDFHKVICYFPYMGKDIRNIHDEYFKFIFQNPEHVKTFIEEFVPEISKYADLSTLKINPTEKFNVKKKKKYFLDFSASCKINNIDTCLYFLFEHKSVPDKYVLIQILNYISSVWEDDIRKNNTLTPIIPIVFYMGTDSWNIPTDTKNYFSDFPDEVKDNLLRMRYILFNINDFNSDQIKERFKRDRLFMLALDLMKNVRKGVSKDVLKGLVKELDESMSELGIESVAIFVEMSIIYMQEVVGIGDDELEELLQGGTMSNIFERKYKQGIQQGMLKAKLEELAFALDLKFGASGAKLYSLIQNKIHSLEDIEKVKMYIKKCSDISEFRSKLEI